MLETNGVNNLLVGSEEKQAKRICDEARRQRACYLSTHICISCPTSTDNEALRGRTAAVLLMLLMLLRPHVADVVAFTLGRTARLVGGRTGALSKWMGGGRPHACVD